MYSCMKMKNYSKNGGRWERSIMVGVNLTIVSTSLNVTVYPQYNNNDHTNLRR
jgi:hypothetical protein